MKDTMLTTLTGIFVHIYTHARTPACVWMAWTFCRKTSKNANINKAFYNYANTLLKD